MRKQSVQMTPSVLEQSDRNPRIPWLRQRGVCQSSKFRQYSVEFTGVRDFKKIYVQLARVPGGMPSESECADLLSVRDAYPKFFLSASEFAGGNLKGIKVMHVADFLLSDEF